MPSSILLTHQNKLLWLLKLSVFLFFILHFSPLDEKIISQVFYIGVILPTLLLIKKEDIYVLWRSPITKVLVLYLLYVSVAWLFAGKTKYLRYGLYILIFTCSVWVLLKYKLITLDNIAVYFFVLSVLGILLGFLWIYFSNGKLPYRPYFIGWMTENPIHLSSILAVSCVGWISVFLIEKKYLIATIGLLICFYLMYVFKTRTGYFALGTAFVCLLIFRLYFLDRKHLSRLFIFSGCFLIVVSVLYTFGFLDVLLDRGTSYRLVIWSVLLEQFKQCNYLLGCGYDYDVSIHYFTKNEPIVNAHSIYVSELFYSGVLGLVLLLSFIFTTLYYGIKNNLIWIYAFVAACGAFAVDGHIAVRPPRNEAWLIFWLPLVLVNVELIKTKFEQSMLEKE